MYIGKEKVISFIGKSLKAFPLSEFENILSEHFDGITYANVEKLLVEKKLMLNNKNLALVILAEIERLKWSVEQILKTAFHVHLEYIIKYHKRFEWTSHKFVGKSNLEEIPDLSSGIHRTIRNHKEDALVLVKEDDGVFWVSVILKKLKTVGLYHNPCYLAIVENGRYFFTKAGTSDAIVQYITTTLGYEKERKIKLTGKSVKSLVKLLVRRETVDMNHRPIFRGGTAIETKYGFDMTCRQNFEDYFAECMDNDTDIEMERYTISATDCPWVGDKSPALSEMIVKSSMTLSGNVGRIIKQLPIASMIQPPFPDFFKNFSVQARSRVRTTNAD